MTRRRVAPRALIVSIYGLYAHAPGSGISVAALIRLMAELGVDGPAVRSSISRLKRTGILEPGRVGGAAGYLATERARAILEEGEARIFGRPDARVADGWLLAVFSVPEHERAKRHELRSRLTWLGFGTAAPGVWIAPAHLFGQARAAIDRLGLSDYVDLFRADHLAFADLGSAVASWWDLAGLRSLYDAFLAEQEPVVERWTRPHVGAEQVGDDPSAFADYVRALTQWRRLPFLDPGLPAEVLPSDWPGSRATEVVAGLQDRLAHPAARHVHAVTGIAADPMPAVRGYVPTSLVRTT